MKIISINVYREIQKDVDIVEKLKEFYKDPKNDWHINLEPFYVANFIDITI